MVYPIKALRGGFTYAGTSGIVPPMPFKNNPAKTPRDAVLQGVIDQHGISKIARALDPEGNLSKQAVYAWPRVPEKWLNKMARIFRRSKHQLRPDIYARNGRKLTQGR